MTLGEKIAMCRKEKNLTQSDLAKKIHTTAQNVSQYERGIRNPKWDTLLKLAEALEVSIFELADNNMLDIHTTAVINTKVDITKMKLSQAHKTADRGVKIPVLGTVTTGVSTSTVENILAYEEITPELAETGEFFALRIQGDSMEPRIKDGDIVVVKVQSDVESGEIAVAIIGGNIVTVKKVIKQAEGIVLQAYNPAYESLFFATQNNENLAVQIIGRVIELRAQL